MATQNELLSLIRDRLDEPTEGYWRDITLRRYLNEAVTDIARKSEIFRTDATLAIVAGTQSYTLPTNLVTILEHSTYFKPTGASQRYPLEAVDYSMAIQRWGVNQAITQNRPTMYTVKGYSGSSGALAMLLYPIPSQAGTVYYTYAKVPTALNTDGSAAGSTVDLPAGWEDVAVDYVEYRALLQRRDREGAGLAKARYEENLAACADAGMRWSHVPGEFGWDPWGYDPGDFPGYW